MVDPIEMKLYNDLRHQRLAACLREPSSQSRLALLVAKTRSVFMLNELLESKRGVHALSPVRVMGLMLAIALLMCVGASAQAASDGLTLRVTDGASGQSLVKQKVYGYVVKANGTIASITGSPFFSDDEGVIELAGLDAELTYYFKTVDLFNRWQRTEHLSPGDEAIAFRVGVRFAVNGDGVVVESETPEAFSDEALAVESTLTEPEVIAQPNEAVVSYAAVAPSAPRAVQTLEVSYVTLTNALSGDGLAGVSVYAYQVNDGGANTRVEGWPKTTDANGHVSAVDLLNGNSYYLKARVYNGKWTRTDVFVRSGGDIAFEVGSLEIALVDTSAHIPGDAIPAVRVNIEKHLGGDQYQIFHSIRADGAGVVRTDVEGLGVDVAIRISIANPNPGTVSAITLDGDNVTSDLIVAPGNYAFAVMGELPQEPPANYVALQTINRATFGMNLDLLGQVDGLSHAEAVAWADAWILEQLEYPGGIAAASELVFRDKIQGANRVLPYYPGTPQNPGSLGTLVPFESNPAWAPFAARMDSLPVWRELNTSQVLAPNDFELDRIQLMHMIESPWQLRELMTQFWDNHFSTEISASGNRRLVEHNETLGFRVDRLITEGQPTEETPEALAARRIFYFNLSGNLQYLSSSGALGNFPSLLYYSATNPSMVVYLNSADSTKADPNENYAREVFELHCLGVDNGYALGDIKEAARVFTGWNIISGPHTKPGSTGNNNHNAKFNFIASRHSNGSGEYDEYGAPVTDPNKYTIIRANADFDPPNDNVINVYDKILYRSGESGVHEGLELLDRLSRLRETALFISGKLVEMFVSDEPLPDLQSRVADVFEANVDHLEQVKLLVYTILTSPEFRALENFRSKIKTPLEDTTGLHRQLMPNVADMWTLNLAKNNGSNGEYGAPRSFLDAASMGMYGKVEPTGYPENGAEWLDTDGLLKRLNHHYDVSLNNYIGPWTIPNPNPNNLTESKGLRAYRWMTDVKGFTTEDEVIDYLLGLLTNGYATHVERDLYHTALSFHQAFNLVNPSRKDWQDDNIRLLMAYILTSPQYLYQ